jgi:hypothetical protein
MQPSIPRAFTKLDAVVISVIGLAGLIHLPYPFGDDQSLFTMGALKISQGGVLYRDFWDAKQPGIYAFYLVAGKLFGFNEVGTHTLDVLYMVALSAVLILTLRNYFAERWLVSLVPLFTVGFYYGASGRAHLTLFFTQVEALAGLPIYLALWFAFESIRLPKRRGLSLFFSGLAGGIALLFKLMFLPILLTFWFTLVVFSVVQNREQLPRVLVRCGVPITLGVLVPLLITAGYFAKSGALGPLVYTSFQYPLLAVRETAQLDRRSQLLAGFQWFLDWFAPLLALGVIGAWGAWRRSRDFLTANLALWVAVGLFVIYLQRLSWWAYHYLLLFVPLGILAAKGVDVLWEHLRESAPPFGGRALRIVMMASLALLLSPVAYSWLVDALMLAHHRFALRQEDRLKLQERIDPRYSTLRKDTAFLLAPNSLPGDIYVFGSYRYYTASGRNQAIALNAESPELLTPEQWNQITEQLARVVPPYVFVANDVQIMPAMAASRLPNLIDVRYRVLQPTSDGIWYVLRNQSN